MTEYSTAFKANMVKKLLMPGGPTASALSSRSGISQPTLSRWLRDARDGGMPSQPKHHLKVPRRPGVVANDLDLPNRICLAVAPRPLATS